MPFVTSFDLEKINFHILAEPKNPVTSIVIVLGFGGDLNLLDTFTKKLIQLIPNLALYVISLRGHGHSSKKFPTGQHELEKVHAQDLLALIKHLGLTKFDLIGHSFGGVVVQEYLNLPNAPKPEKFFLICSTPIMTGATWLKKFAYFALSRWPISEKFSYQDSAFYRQFANSWDLDIKRWWHDTRVIGGVWPWAWHFFAATAWQNQNPDTLDQQTGYYLYGKKDIIIPKAVQKSRLRKFNKLHQLEIDGGHLTPITNPEDLANFIANQI